MVYFKMFFKYILFKWFVFCWIDCDYIFFLFLWLSVFWKKLFIYICLFVVYVIMFFFLWREMDIILEVNVFIVDVKKIVLNSFL